MYVPPHFRVADEADKLKLIREHGFAVLVSQAESGMLAVHLPLTLIAAESVPARLIGHVSVANPIWRSFREGAEVLAIFSGPHSYVSPRWYNHTNVPTWNYMAVHAYGQARILQQAAEVHVAMKGLVDQYEADSGVAEPYRMEQLPAKYLASQMKGIVAFEVTVNRLEASFKLSQNRDAESHANVVQELAKSPDAAARAVAEAMRERSK